MCKVEGPLLFIPTPPIYYIEVETEQEEPFLEESTSVYEISRTERINPVIAKQLNYFSQPARKKAGRSLLFNLKNNERIMGVIEEFDGFNVKIKTSQAVEKVNGNDILSILTVNKTF